jgi:hypothetical protein
MNGATQGLLIMASFALAHERVLEFLRWWMGRLPPPIAKLIDTATHGGWAWIPGVALALASNANVIDVFRQDPAQPSQSLFFASYLHGLPNTGGAIVGCCVMGLAVTLGSSFWHDLAQGLIAMRGNLAVKAATPDAAVVVAGPAVVGPIVVPPAVPPLAVVPAAPAASPAG